MFFGLGIVSVSLMKWGLKYNYDMCYKILYIGIGDWNISVKVDYYEI